MTKINKTVDDFNTWCHKHGDIPVGRCDKLSLNQIDRFCAHFGIRVHEKEKQQFKDKIYKQWFKTWVIHE